MIIIIATFAQALSGNSSAVKIIGALIVWRFIVSPPPPPRIPPRLTPSSLDGRGHWRGLPSKCSHFLGIRFNQDPWSYDDSRLCFTRMG